MRVLVILILFWLSTVCASAQGITATLVVPTTELAPGQRVEVSLVLLNATEKPTRTTMPNDLHARILGDGLEWVLPIEIKSMPVPVISPRGFSHATCVFVVPEDASGRLVMEISEPLVRAVLDVRKPSETAAGAVVEVPKLVVSPLADERRTPAMAEFHRVFAENISTHLPIFFVGGPKKPAVKFQFSFKYRIVGDKSARGTLNPPLSGLYFGYTQRSVWDITSYSSPFYDTSYMPELMWESLAPAPAKPGFLGFRWFGYQASFQHESNGRDGDRSRSLNKIYVRPVLGRDIGAKWTLVFAPKLFYYVDNLSDNPDLERYRGYGEYTLGVARKNGLSLMFLGRIGSHFDRGSVQADLTYPLQISYGHFANFLLVQYFDGYGESLLSYNTKSRMLRVGCALVR